MSPGRATWDGQTTKSRRQLVASLRGDFLLQVSPPNGIVSSEKGESGKS